MASLAAAIQGAISPKKRYYSDFSGNSESLPSPKRLHSHDSSSTNPRTTPHGGPALARSNPTIQVTGLEGILDLDQQFVDATEVTANDEAGLNFHDTAYEREFSFDARRRLANELSRYLPDSAHGEGRGLPNINGTLCYRHSLFQALLHAPKFVNWLIEHHRPEHCVSDETGDCVSCHMRRLCVLYWSARSSNVEEMIMRLLVRINTVFQRLGWHPHSDNGHGDPDDQLGWMLEQMRHEMSSSAFNYFEGFHVSVLESEIVCDNCGNVSKTGGNNERHFPIPIRSRSSRHRASQLSGLIDAYMDEIVDGYRCEKEGCGSVAQKHRVQKIVYAPDILLIQLKRFNWYGSKDCSRIGFSERLNLTRHASHESMGSLDYELVAVICHQGSVGFGHYICVARTDAKPLSKKWAEYDDQAMCATTVNTAINPTKELGRDWTPYLLFYKRNEETVPTKHFRREECRGILERTGI